jgi:uncharacterized protein YmfQ (DUF2313 family)
MSILSKCTKPEGKFFCPTKWQIFDAIGSLLPHGRAWQTWDWAYGATSVEELPGVMQRYWATFAEVVANFCAKACSLLDEFFCQSARETLDLWYLDYGFPDECDPYSALCEKVAARGGSTCAYLTDIAAKRGWVIECRDSFPATATADCVRTDCDRVGVESFPNVLFIDVVAWDSPAYISPIGSNSAECLRADAEISCGPDMSSLICLLERIKPAHVLIEYSVDYAPSADETDITCDSTEISI